MIGSDALVSKFLNHSRDLVAAEKLRYALEDAPPPPAARALLARPEAKIEADRAGQRLAARGSLGDFLMESDPDVDPLSNMRRHALEQSEYSGGGDRLAVATLFLRKGKAYTDLLATVGLAVVDRPELVVQEGEVSIRSAGAGRREYDRLDDASRRRRRETLTRVEVVTSSGSAARSEVQQRSVRAHLRAWRPGLDPVICLLGARDRVATDCRRRLRKGGNRNFPGNLCRRVDDGTCVGRPADWTKIPANSLDRVTYGRVVAALRHRTGHMLIHRKLFGRTNPHYQTSGIWLVVRDLKVLRRKAYFGQKAVRKPPRRWAARVIRECLSLTPPPLVDDLTDVGAPGLLRACLGRQQNPASHPRNLPPHPYGLRDPDRLVWGPVRPDELPRALSPYRRIRSIPCRKRRRRPTARRKSAAPASRPTRSVAD